MENLANDKKRENIIKELSQFYEIKNEEEITLEGQDTFCRATIHILINNIPFFMIKSMNFKMQKDFIEIWHNSRMISHIPLDDIQEFSI